MHVRLEHAIEVMLDGIPQVYAEGRHFVSEFVGQKLREAAPGAVKFLSWAEHANEIIADVAAAAFESPKSDEAFAEDIGRPADDPAPVPVAPKPRAARKPKA